jgi:hypothetical protein
MNLVRFEEFSKRGIIAAFRRVKVASSQGSLQDNLQGGGPDFSCGPNKFC